MYGTSSRGFAICWTLPGSTFGQCSCASLPYLSIAGFLGFGPEGIQAKLPGSLLVSASPCCHRPPRRLVRVPPHDTGSGCHIATCCTPTLTYPRRLSVCFTSVGDCDHQSQQLRVPDLIDN